MGVQTRRKKELEFLVHKFLQEHATHTRICPSLVINLDEAVTPNPSMHL
jgi:hypothetical protein